MRKATGIVSVSNYEKGFVIRSLVFRTADANLVTMICYEDSMLKPYVYRSILEIQKSIVNIAKSNNFQLKRWHDFGMDWYDIITIMTDTGKIAHYACLGE